MRLAFFLLTLLLIAVVGWATWAETHPQWLHYQRTLRERSEVRLLAELEAAEEELERPETIATLTAIDAQLAELDAGNGEGARKEQILGTTLPALREETRRLRSRMREEEARFAAPGTSARHRARLALLAMAESAYAEESGRWPPDEVALERTHVYRDSLLAGVAEALRPVDSLVARVDSLRAMETRLHEEVARLGVGRDSLLAERVRIVSRVETARSALRRLRAEKPSVREIVSTDGREIARCPTCHGALGDIPPTHSELATMDPFVDVPCTVCHRGNGRALDVGRAHIGLLSGAGRGVGKYSLQARMDELQSGGPAVRRAAMEELRRITGIDPPQVEGEGADPEAAEAEAWVAWWTVARRYFEATEPSAFAVDVPGAADFDSWSYSTAGRPLRYVGSRECLGCHRTTHREHSERWLATKFQSLDRLRDVADPRPCYRCHATGYDEATGQYAEAGVTCEACHGPGEIYSEMMFIGAELNGRGQTGRGRELLDASSRMARDATSARTTVGDAGRVNTCVSCHNPRRHLEGGPSILERTVEARAALADSLASAPALPGGGAGSPGR